jgi:hypothetical protein
MFIHLDDQKLVGGKKKRKKGKSARWNSFHPHTSASRVLIFRPHALFLAILLPTDRTLLSSLHPRSCCHCPCPPLPFADQMLVSSPHPSAFHCCPCPPLLPPQPCYSLEGIFAVLKVLFWISSKLFC